jgi:Domain of unknown function (DUF4411)
MSNPTSYSLDTNSFLTAWNDTYRPGSFPGFWRELEGLISSGRACTSEEVIRELSKKDDGVYQWAKEQELLSVELEEEQIALTKALTKQFPVLAKERLGRMRADGFVIALAQWKDLTVVTAENRRGPEKIPNLCDGANVTCITLADLIESEGWSF